MRGSIRGWVYIEAYMNPSLISLLRLTPGIISTRQEVLRQLIDFEDWTKMLTMKTANLTLEVGKWAQVKRGLYKGDVGCVVGVEHWGVELLLLPRLKAHAPDPSGKRKRTRTRPKISLFDPDECSLLYNIVAKRRGNGSYSCGGMTFEHGLVRKSYDYHSISSTVISIPSINFTLYMLSDHPTVRSSTFPKPTEWIFEKGEKVYAYNANPFGGSEIGTITAVNLHSVEVDLGFDLGGEIAVPWHEVRKIVNMGDYVTVCSGQHCGTSGWVVGINCELIRIVEKLHDDGNVCADPDTLKVSSFHI
jgi:hypothetical protein